MNNYKIREVKEQKLDVLDLSQFLLLKLALVHERIDERGVNV